VRALSSGHWPLSTEQTCRSAISGSGQKPTLAPCAWSAEQRTVIAAILVEGWSDQAALEALAHRHGLRLAAERIVILRVGGAMEATRPPGTNSLQQQPRFDAFVHEFNAERPHEALQMKRPADVYSPSPRPYKGLPELSYPLHELEVLVTACG
jgi:hypothetical protein